MAKTLFEMDGPRKNRSVFTIMEQPTIAENLIKLSDRELIEVLPYVRNEDGERVNLIELKHMLREAVKK